MNLFTAVARNTAAQVLGRSGVVLLTIISTAILTRLLGTVNYGQYVFVMAVVLFFTAIADWGTALISVREAAKNITDEEKFLGNAFLLRLLLTVFAILLINLLVYFLPQFRLFSNIIIIMSSLLLLISLKTSAHIVFQTKQRFEYMSLLDLLISFVFLLFLIFVVKTGDLSAVLIYFLIANILGVFLSIYISGRLAKLNFNLNTDILKRILFEAVPTGALLLIFSIYNRLDIFLLQLIKGPESVGIYGLAYKVHDNLILGAAYLMSALFPVLSSLIGQSKSQDKITTIYRKTFDILFVSGLFVLISVFIFAPLIISVIGGPEFSKSVIVLRILVFATLLSYFNHLTGYTLIALSKQKVSLLVAVAALVWNIVLNLILIPYYSFTGAAMATIATEGLVLILTSFYLARNFGLTPRFTFFQTVKELIRTKGKIY